MLELNCNLNVVATSSDGLSAKRKFYRLHKHIMGKKQKNSSKTLNLFARQRSICFFADVPHLMKTRDSTLRPILLLRLTPKNLLVNEPNMLTH